MLQLTELLHLPHYIVLMLNYLDFSARKGKGYLHPGGKKLTEVLITTLDLFQGARVLEVGCGTGATIVKIAKQYNTESVAVDFSDSMLRSAKQRAWLNRVSKKITFVKVLSSEILPFEDNYFNVVYAESVLGIVNENELPKLVGEIFRVLKPGGKLVTNDAIWKDTSIIENIHRINTACLNDFGIVQSISRPAYKAEWIKLFEDAKFQLIRVVHKDVLKDLKPTAFEVDLFLIYKLICSTLSLRQHLRSIDFNRKLRGSHQNDGSFLDSYLFVLKKPFN